MRAKFNRVPNMSVWQESTFSLLEKVIEKIEVALGRANIFSVPSEDHLLKNYDDIVRDIERAPHFW